MIALDLDIPRFTIRRGDKKKTIINNWLNGKGVKASAKAANTSETYALRVINEINK